MKTTFLYDIQDHFVYRRAKQLEKRGKFDPNLENNAKLNIHSLLS